MRLSRLSSGIAAAFLFLHCSAVAHAEAIDLSRMIALPNPSLGLAFPGSRTEYYPLIAQAGIGVVRLSVAWARVEPSQGTLDWSGLDARITALQENGIEPFLTFESNADWGVLVETRGVKNGQPEDSADWVRFVRAVVDRYDADGLNDMPGLRGRIRYWQAANEWISDKNRSGGWAGTTEDLIAFIQQTHDAVKAEDPHAIFVLGGVASFNADVLLVSLGGHKITVRQAWRQGAETVLTVADIHGGAISNIINRHVIPVLERSPFDVADVHLYGPEDRDAARLRLIHELTGRPVLSAECGGPSLDYGGTYTPRAHFRAVVERNLGVLAADARFCLWFRLGEGPGATYGNRRTALYTADAAAKPGVFAYRMLSRLLDPGTTVLKAGPDHFTLRRGEGQTIWIGWNAGAERARDYAEETESEVFCLEDAGLGRLSADPARCGPNELVVAGQGLGSLLSP